MLKRFGDWQSDAAAERYVVQNLDNKKRISARITAQVNKYAKKPRIETVTSTTVSTPANESMEIDIDQIYTPVTPSKTPTSIVTDDSNIHPIIDPTEKTKTIQSLTTNSALTIKIPDSSDIEIEGITSQPSSIDKDDDFSKVICKHINIKFLILRHVLNI